MHQKPDNQNQRSMKWGSLLFASVMAAVLAVVLFSGAQYGLDYLSQNQPHSPEYLEKSAVAKLPMNETTAQLKKTSESFRSVARVVGPAVVRLKVYQEKKKSTGRRQGGKQMDPFFEFFERFGIPQPGEQGPKEGTGSGVIIDSQGYIVTNNHVVEGATKVIAILSESLGSQDGKELKAKIVGTDPKTDLAVLKIESDKPLPAAEWADIKSVEVGDWAIAIGSPFSLTQSVTVGIVSAKGRSSRMIGADYAELIQTDAAINPGNSGGPLCTLDGKVMGINTAIFSRSGGYMGIGFAIPSGVARDVASTLIKDGKMTRGWLGVLIEDPPAKLKKDFDLSGGVMVSQVVEDSPAIKAGVKPGDIVLQVNGESIKNASHLQKRIAKFRPKDSVSLKLFSLSTRQYRNVKVRIGQLPESTDKIEIAKQNQDQDPDKLGLVVVEGPKGLTVADVSQGVAGYYGVEKGDVIQEINGKKLFKVSEYYKSLKSSSGYVVLVVKRDQATRVYTMVLKD